MIFTFEISSHRFQDSYEIFRSRSPLSSLAKEQAMSKESCSYTWNADPSLPLLKSFLVKKVTGMRVWGVHVGMGEGDNIKWDHFPSMLGYEIWENTKLGKRNHKAQMLLLSPSMVLSMTPCVTLCVQTLCLTKHCNLHKDLYHIGFVALEESSKCKNACHIFRDSSHFYKKLRNSFKNVVLLELRFKHHWVGSM